MRQGKGTHAATIAVPVVPPASAPRVAKRAAASQQPTIQAEAIGVQEPAQRRRGKGRAKRSTVIHRPAQPAALARTMLADEVTAESQPPAAGARGLTQRVDALPQVQPSTAQDDEYEVDLQSMAAMSLPPDLLPSAAPAAVPEKVPPRSSRPITLGHAIIERQQQPTVWLLGAAGAALVTAALLLGTVAFATT